MRNISERLIKTAVPNFRCALPGKMYPTMNTIDHMVACCMRALIMPKRVSLPSMHNIDFQEASDDRCANRRQACAR